MTQVSGGVFTRCRFTLSLARDSDYRGRLNAFGLTREVEPGVLRPPITRPAAGLYSAAPINWSGASDNPRGPFLLKSPFPALERAPLQDLFWQPYRSVIARGTHWYRRLISWRECQWTGGCVLPRHLTHRVS